ncbi:MAG: RNA-splicing ligase RtcB [Nitrospirae bacterium GWA2_42_11]|nr:MAG: RNA-splicing ligase RtcB [Nitrospirae bacterium GWA2_42_11]
MEIKSLKKISDYIWEIPAEDEMRVPGRIFASEGLVEELDDNVVHQIKNVACLPGIQQASIAMPDAHWGYGFPIGGVAAFDPDEGGVISMGGIGFDISCGVRTMRTGMSREEIQPDIDKLVNRLFAIVPAGVGSEGKIRLNPQQIDEVLISGAQWAVSKGYGYKEDLRFIEEGGIMDGADPSKVSDMAKKRQFREVGTLGSGNHYLEIQYVAEVYDEEVSQVFGLYRDDVVVSVHCGSRALGHQIGTDYLKTLAEASRKYNIPIRERELVCAPINSPEGRKYYSAVCAGINCALANRQVISHLVREAFSDVVPKARISILYDVSHNTCKIEEHPVEGRVKRLYIHRKGSTRAFGPGRREIPEEYSSAGQPVLIGGTMGTCSYILVGTDTGMKHAFGSACHGAGRALSRTQAKKKWRGDVLLRELASKGIIIRAHSFSGAAEEAPGAYKDVTEVVDATHKAGLAKKVVMLKPMACIKG